VTIPPLDLDDRSFAQLREFALAYVRDNSSTWTDLSASDPGVVLLETFALLTETMIHRLNRLPEKAYRELLGLVGIRLRPPSAAQVGLVFSLAQPAARAEEIPIGTRVASAGGTSPEAPVFATIAAAVIPPGDVSVTVEALHCDDIEESLGLSNGRPGLSFTLARAPVIARVEGRVDIVVGVQVGESEELGRALSWVVDGRRFAEWREVESFAGRSPNDQVFVVDRIAGRVTFAPARDWPGETEPSAMAAVPGRGREIRARYRSGGGAQGNVAAGQLTVMKDPVPGVVSVVNTVAAVGGWPAETLEEALRRAPHEIQTMGRAVTARDYEFLARRETPTVVRAKALTRRDSWSFAEPGAVEVLLVGDASLGDLQASPAEAVRARVSRVLDATRPLGTSHVVHWARRKRVTVSLRIGVRGDADQQAASVRTRQRIDELLSPVPTRVSPDGWPFGQALRASDVFYVAQQDPAVRWVDQVSLIVDDAPDAHHPVSWLAVDASQPRTWYAAAGNAVFRTGNDGDGWEVVRSFGEEEARRVCPHPDAAWPGLVAAVSRGQDGGSTIRVSRDCGESWEAGMEWPFEAAVNDVTWMIREGRPMLLVATDGGLYEVTLETRSKPVLRAVVPEDSSLGFYAVVTTREAGGESTVAVAARKSSGVFISNNGGLNYRPYRAQGQDIRVLAVQRSDNRSYLWAGLAAEGTSGAPQGCLVRELRGEGDDPVDWERRNQGWDAGSCYALAAVNDTIVAGTHHGGALVLDASVAPPQWVTPAVTSGLPQREEAEFRILPVKGVAAAARSKGILIMAGGEEGVYASRDGGTSWETSSRRSFTDQVTLPSTWLFSSGEHMVTVVSADAVHDH
jgi:hypothetical protein